MSYVLAQTGLGAVLDNRPATATGLVGAACCGLLGVLLAHASAGGTAGGDAALDELPFVPGLVLALGSPDVEGRVDDPGVAPPSPPIEPVVSDQAAPADATDEPSATEDSVTEDTTPPRPARPTRPQPEPSGQSPSRPSPLPAPPGPIGNPSRGDPFGDPNGLDDLARDGDAWARGVIAAIEAMDVGTVYAKPIAGTVRFQLSVCKDGTVSKVAYKGGTANVDERDLVLLELGRLRIPRPSASIAAQMQGSCAKIGHTFSWTVDGTR
jgi:hypothetical protein